MKLDEAYVKPKSQHHGFLKLFSFKLTTTSQQMYVHVCVFFTSGFIFEQTEVRLYITIILSAAVSCMNAKPGATQRYTRGSLHREREREETVTYKPSFTKVQKYTKLISQMWCWRIGRLESHPYECYLCKNPKVWDIKCTFDIKRKCHLLRRINKYFHITPAMWCGQWKTKVFSELVPWFFRIDLTFFFWIGI